jgi:hypothetical protein
VSGWNKAIASFVRLGWIDRPIAATRSSTAEQLSRRAR